MTARDHALIVLVAITMSCAEAGRPGSQASCGLVELCNGLDDDCDDEIDEDFVGLGEPCDGTDQDRCTEGTIVCAGPTAMACSDQTADTAEACNAADDDCDLAIDEGLTRTYSKTTGPISGSGQVCCDPGGTALSVADCGSGDNHSASMNGNCGVASEGSGNGGSACAQVQCTGPCVP